MSPMIKSDSFDSVFYFILNPKDEIAASLVGIRKTLPALI